MPAVVLSAFLSAGGIVLYYTGDRAGMTRAAVNAMLTLIAVSVSMFLVAVLIHGTRTVFMDGFTFGVGNLFRTKRVQAEQVTRIEKEVEKFTYKGRTDEIHSFVLWGGEKRLLKFDVRPLGEEEIVRVLQALLKVNPKIELGAKAKKLLLP